MNGLKINRNDTALLLIDIQNDYFKGGLFELHESSEASKVAKNILEDFRKHNFKIIHVKHITFAKFGTFFFKDTVGSEINDDVKPVEGEKIIIKHLISSFAGTDLSKHLKKMKIKNLVIAGMQTNVCVTGAAKDARKKGYNVIIVEDACAAKTGEIHKTQIEYLKEYATIITSSGICKLLE